MEDSKKSWLGKASLVWLLAAAFCFTTAGASAQPYYFEVKKSVPWQQDEIILNHPIEEVAEVMAACWDYDRLIPHVRSARKLSSNQCYVESRILNVTFWMRLHMEQRVSQDKKVIIVKARLLKGNVERFEADCTMSSMGENKTRVVLRMKADVGLPDVADVKLGVRLILGR
jgi:hypothetical protein